MAAVEKRGGHAPFIVRAVKPSSPSARQRRSKSDLDDREAKCAPRSSQKASSQTKLVQSRNSNPQQKCETKKEIQQPRSETQSSLKKEILQLEMHLKDQQVVRGALEKALGPNDDDPAAPAPPTLQHESPALKPATQLIREVATLELEIKHLEQYLLTLYRKAFEQQQQVSTDARRDREAAARKLSVSSSRPDETPRVKAAPVVRGGGGGDPTMLHYGSCPPLSGKGRRNNGGTVADDCSPSTCPRRTTADLVDTAGLRSQSALSFRGAWSSSSSRISPTEDSLARALRSCHSQPFSFLEEGETAPSGVVSLADYLGTSVADHIPETPNNLSEEMVRCMAGVYCRLADPPLLAHHRPSSSPSSSLSSAPSVVSHSPQQQQHLGGDADMWSPSSYCGRKEDGARLDSRLINPFRVEGLKEFSGPYSAMVEVPAISRDRTRLRDTEDLLQTYKLILYRMETVDLRRMTGEEKLAFWINVHNALVMHAYLKYGVPQNQLKKTSLLVKAECKIAGRAINAAVIQGLVLGCTTHCSSGHWLRSLLHYPRTKTSRASKAGAGSEEWRAFAVRQPEPLLRFALCSGSHSDPAVRVYFPKRLAQQLEAAREEYVRATAGVWKDHRVLLPKLLDAYARDAGLSPDRLLDAVQRCLPETLRTAVHRCRHGDGGGGGGRSAGKVVEWVPHRQSFRYLLARDLAFPHLS
ncbi:hypothetical protein BDA96_02G021500 [Sorghum bicolor]|uniref:DUF547 domain-containing protein n=2 Tax=Sorghum bicolor TaxID=4558 RepID=A0A1B6Q8R5_SORBI|nr:uncharacterized protein LOC8059891 isoform X2 [Sorghum bicolor]KAG0541495.1 hypothetical protein BDA96_02G021500 [Sorghum bicolor]KXG34315.1 hypothetical protein SORBI_3002G020500 [Sorghum bicolor]OQU88377.1 hypothetical protein SORBI_3002G020500 [Sorghum bicolor]|eukprot:XP_021308251.1 uncharacterized protein LOC8059891 isoform X2 [Sorghum bicolor]